MANCELAKQKMHNIVLVQLLLWGQYLHAYGIQPDLTSQRDRVGSFLYQYFREEPGALVFLTKVSPNFIDRLSARKREEVLNSRLPRPPPRPSPVPSPEPELEPQSKRVHLTDSDPSVILSQDEDSQGEVWYTNQEIPDLPSDSPTYFDELFDDEYELPFFPPRPSTLTRATGMIPITPLQEEPPICNLQPARKRTRSEAGLE
jgi:hypothetical protein